MKKYAGKSCNIVEPTKGNFVMLSSQVCVFSNTKIAMKTTPYLRSLIENISKVCDVSLKADDTFIEPMVEERFKNSDAIMVVSHMDTGGKKKVEFPIYYPYTYFENPLVCEFRFDIVGYNPAAVRKWYTMFGSIDGSFIYSSATRTHRVLTVAGVYSMSVSNTVESVPCLKTTSFHKTSSKLLDTITDAYPDIYALDKTLIQDYKENGNKNLQFPMPCNFEEEIEIGDYIVLQYVMPMKPDGSGECTLLAKI